MTPKEFEFFVHIIEETARRVYALGYQDAKAGKSLKKEGFSMSLESRLVLKTKLKKHLEKR